MTKRTKALLLVGVIFISSMAGCLSEVSSQVEAENADLKTENAALNSTIANLTLENQNLSSLQIELMNQIANLTEMMQEMGDPTTPLLYETYNSSDKYMNHANWNGGLWERVTFDDDGCQRFSIHMD